MQTDGTRSTTRDTQAAPAAPARLVSLDAYRGFVMLAMVSGGLGLASAAEHFPGSRLWEILAYEFEHVAWTGCALWDLIQPSFMFIVGVSMPYSYAARRARGDSATAIVWHVVSRALILTFLGVFLRSNGRPQTNFTFEDVSSQIGLGYALAYLVLGRGWRVQAAAVATVLLGYWALFALWPLVPADFSAAAQHLPDDWRQFEGFAAHWNKHVNPAGWFDRWFLNLFPRAERFTANGGGYQTLNFIPSLGTMIFGIMAGEYLRAPGTVPGKVLGLLAAGAACLAAGLLVDGQIWPLVDWQWSLAPIVKRIWTPSWAVFSTGWTLGTLALFVLVVDVWGFRRVAWPLCIVGMNSVSAYVLSWLFRPWVVGTLRTHLGQDVFEGPWGSVAQALVGVAAVWLVCWSMYRKKVFIRV